jgi:hypothetical protein
MRETYERRVYGLELEEKKDGRMRVDIVEAARLVDLPKVEHGGDR